MKHWQLFNANKISVPTPNFIQSPIKQTNPSLKMEDSSSAGDLALHALLYALHWLAIELWLVAYLCRNEMIIREIAQAVFCLLDGVAAR